MRTYHAYVCETGGYIYLPEKRTALRIPIEDARILCDTSPHQALRRADMYARYVDPAYLSARLHHSPKEDAHAIFLHIANDCNMRCIYCYADGGTYGAEKGMMEWHTAETALRNFIANLPPGSSCIVNLFGGEPLLNFKVLKSAVRLSIEQGQQYGHSVELHLVTNGTLLKSDIVDFLATEGIMVTVSIDGDAKVQNRQRPMLNGAASYDKVTKNLSYLLHKIPNTTARATYATTNISLFETYQSLFKLGFKAADVAPDFVHAFATNGGTDLIREVHNLGIAIRREHKGKNLEKYLPIWRRISRLTTTRPSCRSACRAGELIHAVSAEGTVYPCHRFVGLPQYALGRPEEGLSDQHPLRSVNRRLACDSCWNRYLCTGGCPFDSIVSNLSPNVPLPNWCAYSRVLSEVSIDAAWNSLSVVEGAMESANN